MLDRNESLETQALSPFSRDTSLYAVGLSRVILHIVETGEHDRDPEKKLREDAGPASCATANLDALVKPALVIAPPPTPQSNRKKMR